MALAEKDQQHYHNLLKGYSGEVLFDSLIEKLQGEFYRLDDLLLKVNNTHFQIDSLIISDAIYLFEVKNYDGDYYYESDQLYKKSGAEIVNPLNQLRRSESLLRQLLHSHGFLHTTIHASVIFINPEFTLYQAPLNLPFLYPTQIHRYLKKIEKNFSKSHKEKHRGLARKLISLHMEESPFKQIPTYHYEQLKRGITCPHCNSLSMAVTKRKIVCSKCGKEEKMEAAVMRSVEEFRFLFPNEKITTHRIHEWCQIIESKKRVQRILEKNLSRIGHHRWSYYR